MDIIITRFFGLPYGLWSLEGCCSYTMLDGEDITFEQVHTSFYQALIRIEASSSTRDHKEDKATSPN
ncbi:hypothetical protein F8M41_016300 [Gigaspora margarita]|uniref:Uncharacterized protein n=1 Tax=Gigaspora margarita TaxID=4874 RepID=A0A8H4B351_GIGMA|nr:hypothetical protein F8M41_016300 [Gigaspora margarita]